MKNKKIIFVVLIFVLAITVIGLAILLKSPITPTPTVPSAQNPPIISPLSQGMSCEEMYNEIENDLDNANYCEKNSDCAVIMLGSVYIKFGCYHYINKNVDEEQIFQKMRVYDKNCRSMINKCLPAPEAQCVSGKCVTI